MIKNWSELEALAKQQKEPAAAKMPDWLELHGLYGNQLSGKEVSAEPKVDLLINRYPDAEPKPFMVSNIPADVYQLPWLSTSSESVNPSRLLAQSMFCSGRNYDYRQPANAEFPVVPIVSTAAAAMPQAPSRTELPPTVPPSVKAETLIAVCEPKPAAETPTKPAATRPEIASPVAEPAKAEAPKEKFKPLGKKYKPTIVDGQRKICVDDPEYYEGVRPQALAAPDTESFRKLQKVVEPMIGHKMREYEPWFNTAKRMEDGCAAFVSEVLQRRYRINGDWRVEELEDSIRHSGKFIKVKFEDAQPGDIIIGHRRPWFDGLYRAGHSAIMWTDGNLVNNNSRHKPCPQIDVQPVDKFFVIDPWDGQPQFKSVVAYRYVGDVQYAQKQRKKQPSKDV